VPEEFHDFGRIYHGATVRTRFTVANEGSATLALGPVRSRCKCSRGELDRTALEPGEQTEVEVVFHSLNYPGNQNREVELTTGDPRRPKIALRFHAEVVPLYEVSPLVANFGRFYVDEGGQAVLRIHVVADEIPELLSLEPSEPCLTASSRPFEAGPRRGYEVTLKLDGAPEPGPFLATCTARFDHPEVPELVLHVQGVAVGGLAAEPVERIDFGRIPRGETSRRSVQLTLHGNRRTVRLESPVVIAPEVSGTEIEARLETREPGRRFELFLEVTPGESARFFQGRVELASDLEEQPLVTIPFHGLVADS
jgi:hypothetical protein